MSTAEEVLMVSAKEGIGIAELLEAIVNVSRRRPRDPAAPLRALIFDSCYDRYRGAIRLCASSMARCVKA